MPESGFKLKGTKRIYPCLWGPWARGAPGGGLALEKKVGRFELRCAHRPDISRRASDAVRISSVEGEAHYNAMAPHALKKRRLNPLDPLDAHDGDNTDHLLSDESSTGGGQEIIEEQADGPETGKRSRMLEKSAGKTHGSPMPVPSVPGGYGSSILKLQIDELLTRLRKDYEKRATGVDNALRKLKTVIEHIPSQEATPVSLSLA